MENQIENQIKNRIENQIKIQIENQIENRMKSQNLNYKQTENFISQLILPDHIIFHILNQNSDF